jgi:radical SAM protein with 4Fe4S-binding SPASM domain
VSTSADAADAGQQVVARMAARAIEQRIPINGSIAMTHRCNLRCVHCYLGSERHAPATASEQDTAFWRSVIDQTAEAGCLNLMITGGEPLVRPDFAEIYSHAGQRGALVTVFTNGTLLDERTVELFDRISPEIVEVTIYGATAAVYEHITGVPGSYQRCLRGVNALLARGIRTGLKTMVLRENRHEIRAMRQMASERGLTFRIDAALFPCRDGCMTPLDHRVPADEAVALEMEDAAFLRKTADYYQRRRDLPVVERLFTCMAGLTSFHVDPEGTLLPCLMVSTHRFDLRQGGFLTGWRDVLAGFQEQGIVPGYECHRCDKRSLCQVCPAQASMETGSPYVKADYLCQLGEARLRAIAPLLDKQRG